MYYETELRFATNKEDAMDLLCDMTMSCDMDEAKEVLKMYCSHSNIYVRNAAKELYSSLNNNL